MEECARLQDGFLMYEVIEIVRKICQNLEGFSDGFDIDNEKIETINNIYSSIESSDYAGLCSREILYNFLKPLSRSSYIHQ